MISIWHYFKKMCSIVRILKRNWHDGSHIYWRTGITEKTVFEGKNIIHKNCSLPDSHIGFMSYMGLNCLMPSTYIGKYCSIASNVEIVYGEHPTNCFVSTHDVFYSAKGYCGIRFCEEDKFSQYRMINEKWLASIGNDVWIGAGAKIMEGVSISDGAVIAAGALVTKDIPPYAVAGGVPAKIMKFRFSNDDISYLRKEPWWDKSLEWIEQNREVFLDIKTYKERISSGSKYR